MANRQPPTPFDGLRIEFDLQLPRLLLLWAPNILFSLVAFVFVCAVWLRTVPSTQPLL